MTPALAKTDPLCCSVNRPIATSPQNESEAIEKKRRLAGPTLLPRLTLCIEWG